MATSAKKRGGVLSNLDPTKVVTAFFDYVTVCEQEGTKRTHIEAYRQVAIEKIRADRDVFMFALERDFGGRQSTVTALLKRLDFALETGDDRALDMLLDSIVDIVKTSPFKTIKDFKQELLDTNYVISLPE